jgi:hypothetical protein
MCIVSGQAVDDRATREQSIPHIFETGHVASAVVVHGRVTVADLEQFVVPGPLQVGFGLTF